MGFLKKQKTTVSFTSNHITSVSYYQTRNDWTFKIYIIYFNRRVCQLSHDIYHLPFIIFQWKLKEKHLDSYLPNVNRTFKKIFIPIIFWGPMIMIFFCPHQLYIRTRQNLNGAYPFTIIRIYILKSTLAGQIYYIRQSWLDHIQCVKVFINFLMPFFISLMVVGKTKNWIGRKCFHRQFNTLTPLWYIGWSCLTSFGIYKELYWIDLDHIY